MKTVQSKLKIVMPLYYYYPYVSGVSVYAKKLAEGLVKSGCEVTVLTSQHTKDLPLDETIKGVKVVRVPVLLKINKGVVMPTFWLKVIRHAKHNDVVNSHLPLPDTGVSSLFIPPHKLITTYQCDVKLSSGIFNRFIVWCSYGLMALQLHRSRAIIVLSKDYFEHSKMRRFLFKAHPVCPPIYPEDFIQIAYTSLAKKLSIGMNDYVVGFMGRIVYEKGIRYLLESIPFLHDEIPNIKVVVAGDYSKVAGGSIKDELDEYIQKYPDKIIFTGYLSQQDLLRFYSMIDVLVLPSIDPLEAFGMVQVEALLCGTPVIASDLPGVREVVRRTGYGLLSAPRNPADIAKKILQVHRNPDRYMPSRARVTEIFNPRQTIDEYLALMSDDLVL